MTTVPEAPPAKPSASSGTKGLSFNYQEYALVGVVVLLIVVGAILEGSAFLSKDNFFNVLRQGSVVGVLAIGMTFVIATAGIDLSVGSMVAASCVAGGWLMENLGIFGTVPSLGFVIGAIGLGIVLGAVNGAAISYGKV